MTDQTAIDTLPQFLRMFSGDSFKSDARVFLSIDEGAFEGVYQSLSSESEIVGPKKLGQ